MSWTRIDSQGNAINSRWRGPAGAFVAAIVLVVLTWKHSAVVVEDSEGDASLSQAEAVVPPHFRPWPEPHEDQDDAYGAAFDGVDSGQVNETKLCNSWCPGEYLDLVDCERKGIDRLKTAFQIENCEAALVKDQRHAVAEKIKKVADSTVFVFFRGAASFFDYNMMCEDKNFTKKKTDMPRVYSNGDCHPENFGVMVQASNNIEKRGTTGDLVWGVNDFDQSFLTPFSWDLKRGATGFALGIYDRGWSIHDVANASLTFIESYVNTILARPNCEFLNTERFVEGSQYVKENATLILKLFEKARKMDQPDETKDWLENKMSVDLERNQFVLNKKRGITPLPESVLPEFQASIDAWLYHGVAGLAKYPNEKDFYKVLAVAKKEGSGTGSIGLQRYYVLIKGRYSEAYGNIILEMKQEVNSVLEVFFRYAYTKSQEGKRAVDAERSAWPYANLFYGWTTFKDDAFIVREKSKHHVGADIEKLSKEEYILYSSYAGRALALYHIRSRCPNYQCHLEDESAVDKEICHNIQRYLHNYGPSAFVRMVYDFAQKEFARQVNAFELLGKFVRHRLAHGSSPLDLLRGQKRPEYCADT